VKEESGREGRKEERGCNANTWRTVSASVASSACAAAVPLPFSCDSGVSSKWSDPCSYRSAPSRRFCCSHHSDLVVRIQVHKVKRVSQSKSGNVWIYDTVCTGYTRSPLTTS
jgi:hypothetical protein